MFSFDVTKLYNRREKDLFDVIPVRTPYDFDAVDEQKEFIPLLNLPRANEKIDHNEFLLQMALLANDSYSDQSGDIPAPWKNLARTATNLPSGYFASAYYQIVNDSPILVISHRGTNSMTDIIEDIRFAREQPMKQVADADRFVNRTLRYMYETFRRVDLNTRQAEDMDDFLFRIAVIHTGHSLGAILAQLCCLSGRGFAYCFDNPGTKETFVQLINSMTITDQGKDQLKKYIFEQFAPDHFYNYQSHLNMINTYGTQVGNVYRMVNKAYDFHAIPEAYLKDPFNIPSYFMLNRYYLTGYTLDQHTLDKIVSYVEMKGKMEADTSPVGLQNAYIEYLNPKRNQLYWHYYFLTCWDYAQQHTRYKPKHKTFDEFYHHGVEVLADIRRRHYVEKINVPTPKQPLVSQTGLFGNRKLILNLPEKPAVQSAGDQPPEYKESFAPSAPEYGDLIDAPALSAEDYDYGDIVRHGKLLTTLQKDPGKELHDELSSATLEEQCAILEKRIVEAESNLYVLKQMLAVNKSLQRKQGCWIM